MTTAEAKKLIKDYYYLSDPSGSDIFVYAVALRYLKQEAKDPDAMLELGKFFFQEQQFDQAIEFYDLADKLKTEHTTGITAEIGVPAEKTTTNETSIHNDSANSHDGTNDLSDRRIYYKPTGGKMHHKDCRMMKSVLYAFEVPFILTAEQKTQHLCRICCKDELTELGKIAAKTSEKQGFPEYMNAVVCCGGVQEVKTASVLGLCMLNRHVGVVTKNVLEGHRCLEKDCRFFVRNESSAYLKAIKKAENERERLKNIRDTEKEQRQRRERKQNAFIEVLKKDLDKMDGMNIVSVFFESPRHVTIHFTTENKRNDIHRFVDGIREIQSHYRAHIIKFVHIKDRDGKYLTTEEYNLIKKNKGYKL